MLKDPEFIFDNLEVAIVENVPAFLRGLINCLEQLGCKIVWAVKSDEEAMEVAKTSLPGIVFIDLRLLRSIDYEDGWQLIKHLRERSMGRTSIIIYSGIPIVDEIVLEAIRLGCSYVVKEDLVNHEKEMITGALMAAISGSVFLSQEVATSIEIIVRRLKGQSLDLLSDKELEVLRLIADGLSNQEIADTLTLALSTIKTHVSKILTKLDVINRGRAAEWYRQNYG